MAERVNVIVSDTKMEAHLRVNPAEGGEDNGDIDFTTVLEASGVRHSLSKARILELQKSLLDPSFSSEMKIATGQEPVAGVDGTLELLFEKGPIPGQLLDDGKVDFSERLTLTPAKEGQCLGRYQEPKEGQPGCDVFGREIKTKKPHNPLPRLGKGVVVNEDGELAATRSGHVVYIESKSLDVDVCYEHKGPVGVASGNLHSEGSLVIKGDVEPGFKVEAGAAVLITGHLNSGEGSAGSAMSVGGCIYGHTQSGAGVVTQEGVAAKNALGARIETQGKIIVEKDAIDCEFWCEEALIGDGKVGRFRGGQVVASRSFIAGETGSRSGVATRISVARPWVLERRIKEWERKYARDSRRFTKNKNNANGRGKGGKMARAQSKKQMELTSLIVEMRRASRLLLKESFVDIGRAYGGTILEFGTLELGIVEETLNARFKYDASQRKILVEKLK